MKQISPFVLFLDETKRNKKERRTEDGRDHSGNGGNMGISVKSSLLKLADESSMDRTSCRERGDV